MALIIYALKLKAHVPELCSREEQSWNKVKSYSLPLVVLLFCV